MYLPEVTSCKIGAIIPSVTFTTLMKAFAIGFNVTAS